MAEDRFVRIEKKIDDLAAGQADLRKEMVAGQAELRKEFRNELRKEIGGLEQRVGVLLEAQRSDVRAVAEGVIGLGERMDRGFADVLMRLDERAAPLEAASRHFASKLSEHDRRLKRPRRRRH